ncbi:MAG: DUF3667 domain-containing protein [Vicingaceae bacterium]|nr:DUF3667 domain-containing protein [Vicingaceae bacterium]
MKFVFGEVFQTLFNLDSKVFRTLKYLIFKPGFLTKEYIEGRRVSYLPPIRIYIALSFIFFFLISVFDFENNVKGNDDFFLNIGENELSTNPEEKEELGTTFNLDGEDVVVSTEDLKQMYREGTLDEGLDSLTADMASIEGYFSRKLAIASVDDKGFLDTIRDQFSLFLILFLPLFALLYGALFSRSKKGFVSHLILNLHLNSFLIFILLLNFCIGSNIGENDVVNFIWGAVLILYIQYYIIKAIMVFYQRKFLVALYKYFLLIVGYALLGSVFIAAVFFASIIMF